MLEGGLTFLVILSSLRIHLGKCRCNKGEESCTSTTIGMFVHYISVIHRFFFLYICNEYFSLSLIGMADDEILRAEMVSQLCMNDRTHSSLLDLVSSLFYQPHNSQYN